VRGTANLVRIVTRQPITAETMRASAGTRRLAFVVSGLAIVASVVCNLLYGPLLKQGWIWVQPASENIWPDLRDRTQRPYRDRLVARVPKQGGVVASFEFLGRLASRRTIHSLHHLYTGFYTFSSEPYPVPRGIDAFLADIGDPRLASYVKPSTPLRLRDLMAANHLRPAAAAGDLILLLREPADTVELVRVGVPPPPVARSVAFDRQLALEGFALPQPEVSEGGLLTVQTYWRRYAPADRQFGTQFLLVNGEGKVVFAVNRHLGYLFYPVSEWPQDSTVRETYRLPIPGQVAPGTYTLALRVAWWRDARSGLSQADPPLSRERPAVVLGPFTVTPASR
jgi:hypothetical protein